MSKGANTSNDFCDLLFKNMDRTVCIAQNFKGYDSYFILKYLYDNMIRSTWFDHEWCQNHGVVGEGRRDQVEFFIDSLNFLPMPLSKFPKTFGLTELAKGYFPHFFNTEANQHYVGPIPYAKYYDRGRPFTSGMTPSVRRSLKWKKNCSNIVDRT